VVRACLEPDLNVRARSFDEVIALLESAMVELQDLPDELPVPLAVPALVDPDATHALPVLRISDRPPPPLTHTLRESAPPPHFAPLPIPPAPFVSSTPHAYASPPLLSAPKRRGGAGIWLTVVLVIAGGATGAWLAPHAVENVETTTAMTSGTATPSVAVSAVTNISVNTETSAEAAPIVSVDALPKVKTTTEASRPREPQRPRMLFGRLQITSSPGSCVISVDGKERGTTPLGALDLSAGAHDLVCTSTNGERRGATVQVDPGIATHYRFTVD
jgi:hypothetical protein